MGQVKQHLQEECEDFMNHVESSIKEGSMTPTEAFSYVWENPKHKELSWDLCGFDMEYWSTLKTDIISWIESIEVNSNE
tara:strand:- start:131 stop:367 length:237 start_codon:yes stop_codon:yes gene_type:complete